MLYLAQHGEALAKEIDPDRPLSNRGAAAVTRMAGFLANAGIGLDCVLHSGKTGAMQTAEIFAKSICETGVIETISGINPNDPVDECAAFVERLNSPTMIVGHLPFMAKLVSRLLIDNEDTLLVEYQPGSVVCLGRDDGDHWVIHWMLRPELLI
ncbi:MAG: phosphohistidine phosphatase SixA [Gammaproteobacteria bacterium]|nr:phosphohistidine phosphatase SixA [Gammaproteobacteria bacterium]